MNKQIIPPYPTLSQIHLEAIVSYKSNGKTLTEKQLPDGSNSLSHEGSPWIPDNDPLTIIVEVDDTAPLLSQLEKVLEKGAIAGVALSWRSKGSLRSGISKPVELEAENTEQHIILELNFEPAELRDTLSHEIVIYLKSPSKKKTSTGQKCRIEGAILGSTGNGHTIRADGKGSTFPVFPMKGDRSDPLWSLDCNWSDCTADKFDENSLRININMNHPDCPDEFKDDRSKKLSPLTRSIVRDAIGTLILQVQNQEGQELWDSIRRSSKTDEGPIATGTVAHAVWYFYNHYNLNDETPAALMQSCGKIRI